jgi:leukotriene B4 12-hydroxydehydrogenase/15-oxo-prostaglandin 13-reductase
MSTQVFSPGPYVNRQFQLAAVPAGMPKSSDFAMIENVLPGLKEGQILIRTEYWSVDPYMRGRITGIKTYADPVLVGDLMVGHAVGEVVESRNSGFPVGSFVAGYWGWQEYCISVGKGLYKLDPAVAPVSAALGVLGMPGATAYFGFLEICHPKQSETVVVSGAAGAVGSYVGQIAKIKGCRVIGIAGADDKCAFLVDELGFDAALNYKTTRDYSDKLKDLCPNGIDCYFDNVGGTITDAVFPLLNVFARVSICGQISQYNLHKPEPGPRLLSYILVKQVRVEGFIVSRWADRFSEAATQMAHWLRAGQLKYREEVMHGFENIPAAFIAMLQGKNIGKMIVRR